MAESLTIRKTVVLRILKKYLGRGKYFSSCTTMRQPTKLQVRISLFLTEKMYNPLSHPNIVDVSPTDYFRSQS
jgi:hypothetical protein